MKETAEEILKAILEGIRDQAQRTGSLKESRINLALRIYTELSKNAVDVAPIDAEFQDVDSKELHAIVCAPDIKKTKSSA